MLPFNDSRISLLLNCSRNTLHRELKICYEMCSMKMAKFSWPQIYSYSFWAINDLMFAQRLCLSLPQLFDGSTQFYYQVSVKTPSRLNRKRHPQRRDLCWQCCRKENYFSVSSTSKVQFSVENGETAFKEVDFAWIYHRPVFNFHYQQIF